MARLGRGGMAEVYKAYQPGLDRYVAVKTLHSHLVEDTDFVGRFEREAHAIGRLRHPNIVQALDFDREDDMYFMAMEFIDGPTLKDEIKARKAAKKPFTLQEVGRIFTALCSAIDYAHSRGMVHRDLKPANVMINQQGQVVLTDFGIARIVGATQFTQTGALSGTPAYMSPEQGQGERADERSDIYSLGVMLYELVTGMVPYDADTPFAVIMKHINEPLPMPRKINPALPEAVERVILKAMSKDPDDRYQTAGAMSRALREAVDLKPGDENVPLAIVAPPPKIQEVEHSTGPITPQEKAATAAAFGSEATLSSGMEGTVTPVPARGFPVLPFVIGGGLIILLILGGIVGAIVISRLTPAPTPTAVTAAFAAVTETAQAAGNAASTAEAEQANATATAIAAADLAVAGPTQTAAAATLQAEEMVAKQTADAKLIGDVLAARDATATAAAQENLAVAETATAEFMANATTTPAPTDTPLPPNTPTTAPAPATPTPAAPADTPTPERPPLSGKLAFSVDDGAGKFDVYIVSVPDGQQLGLIKGARQPYFRSDGVKLLVNGQGGGFGENVFEAGDNGNVEKAVTGSPTDWYPVYSPDGGRVAYSNEQLALGSDSSYHPYIFVQCGLIPPSQEGDQTCQDVARFGILVPNGQIGEIQGSNPIWATNDHIIYKGCNSWAGGGSCGLFTVGSWANKRSSNGETPRKIGEGTSLIPTDTKGNLVAYQSRESGNWEAYVMGLDGGGAINISNNPSSSDGLPTLSPDSRWVAFASDREGGWAVYVAPATGGEATKLFDFPKPNPWATGDRDWTTERMSWGP
ncbi:MAG: serine/threonine-protein kinase [Anaerolineae bacterium]|nr:serine/threonine-protein kinase [Anaerolineae bacterium]